MRASAQSPKYASAPMQTAYQVLAPTGHALEGGEILYTNGLLAINSVHFGLTDHIAISVTPTLWSLFDSWVPFGLMVQPEVRIPLGEKVHLGGYFLASIPLQQRTRQRFSDFVDPFFFPQVQREGLDGLLMGYLTVGTPTYFLTGGVGRFVEEEVVQPGTVVQLSAGMRFGPRSWLMMENYFTRGRLEDFVLDESTGFLYHRFVGYNGFAWELGLTLIYSYGAVIPYLGGSVPLRRTVRRGRRAK